MSSKSFYAKSEERFSSAQALYKNLGQLQRLQFTSLSEASGQRHKTILGPMREGHLRQPSAADYWEYWIDFGQRSLLYLDALRQRGDNTLAHEAAGYPLLLKFPYEVLIDGRDLPRPVNYSLLRITPESDHSNNDERAPVIIIDPRGGHGAGIGGFKQDSAVGESLRAGHPTYFIAFSHSPEPGQTLHDIGVAQARFLEEVISCHPKADKPIVMGNCQAGWALMGLAAARPELPGLVIINGAPLSYWAGVSGRNPMRYSGGLLGGAWMTRLASDLGNDRFDGAWLVSNFEGLNPANTYWSKYYNLFSKVDSEIPRFLDFERWWGSPTLLNGEEIEAIVDDLFIGNSLTGGLGQPSSAVDLRKIEAPVVVFCSYGDDITPPQQALNWIADIYPSDLALRSAGRTIVYLKHATIGHLGIFVSGAVARREHRELLGASEAIGLLAPGLYEMMIDDVQTVSESGKSYEVYFEPRRITDILSDESERERDDEREFALVDQVSQVNSTLYEWFVRPWLRPAINEPMADLMRKTHPFRMPQYLYSSLNPAFSWLAGYAPLVRASRQPVSANNPLLAWQETFSNLVEAQLNSYRDVRDASQEMKFHTVYGGLSALTGAQAAYTQQDSLQKQEQNVIERLRASLAQGGGVEAFSRILLLLGHQSGKISKDRVEQLAEKSRTLIKEFDIDLGNIREIIDQQGLLVFALPVESLETLPLLLVDNDRRKMLLDTVIHLVPELLTAEGAVGELWRQLHELFEQPMPAFVQAELSAPLDSASDKAPSKSSNLEEKKIVDAKVSAKKPTESATLKAQPAATPQADSVATEEKQAAAVKTVVDQPAESTKPKAPPVVAAKTDSVPSGKQKTADAKAAAEKPTESATLKAQPAATPQVDSVASEEKQATAVKTVVDQPAASSKPKAPPAVAAKKSDSVPSGKQMTADAKAVAEKPTESATLKAQPAATPQVDSIATEEKQAAASTKPEASKADVTQQELPTAVPKAAPAAAKKTAPTKAAVKKSAKAAKSKARKAAAKKAAQSATAAQASSPAADVKKAVPTKTDKTETKQQKTPVTSAQTNKGDLKK